MSPVLDAVGRELQGLLSNLRAALADVERLGGTQRLAGDPGVLHAAASGWRRLAAGLREQSGDIERQVGQTLGQQWQGQASQAFAGHWRQLAARLGELAAGHDLMAAALEQAASQAAELNASVAALTEEIGRLVAALEAGLAAAAAAGAAAAAAGTATAASDPTMLWRGRDLLARLQDALRAIEAFWSAYSRAILPLQLLLQHWLASVRPAPVHPVIAPRMQPWPVVLPGSRAAMGVEPQVVPNLSVGRSSGAGTVAAPSQAPDLTWLLAMLAVLAAMATALAANPMVIMKVLDEKISELLRGLAGSGELATRGLQRAADRGLVGLEQALPWLWYKPAPENLPAFPDANRTKRKTPVQGGGGLRRRWKAPDGTIYEWDSQHGTVEKYDRKGRHLGEFDPQTGKQLKPPNPRRKVKP